jgi:hypothetical protein
MVEKLLLQLCYTVIQLPFKGFKKLLGGGETASSAPTS